MVGPIIVPPPPGPRTRQASKRGALLSRLGLCGEGVLRKLLLPSRLCAVAAVAKSFGKSTTKADRPYIIHSFVAKRSRFFISFSPGFNRVTPGCLISENRFNGLPLHQRAFENR